MQFKEGRIYHIYNQGNNRQKIFFERENYLFFLKKMHEYLPPHCHVLAWCLMPNHFHWMVELTNLNATHDATHRMTRSHPMSERTLNNSIAIILRSYTRAINKAQNKTGSLFRAKTKAECLTCIDGITPAFFNTNYGTLINISNPEKEYPQQCFNYIHDNPVKAGLVENPEDWEFSSFSDYYGIRNGTLVNKERTKTLIG